MSSTAKSDYMTLHVASHAETERMLRRGLCADEARRTRIVNCARGELIDEKALEAALADRDGWRRGSGRVSKKNHPRAALCWAART